ncbi:hypothetical protein SLA2020_407960 [Shorea laevis]
MGKSSVTIGFNSLFLTKNGKIRAAMQASCFPNNPLTAYPYDEMVKIVILNRHSGFKPCQSIGERRGASICYSTISHPGCWPGGMVQNLCGISRMAEDIL